MYTALKYSCATTALPKLIILHNCVLNTLRWLLVSAWLKPFIPRTPWGGRLCAPLAATEGQGGLARWSLMIAGAGRPFGGRHGHVGGHLGGFGGGGVPFPIVRRLYGRYLFRSVPGPVPSKSTSQKNGILSMHNLY